MPISLDQVTKEIDLGLPDNLPSDIAKDIKQEVGDFVVASILDYVGQGKSPVTGRGFKALSQEYAEKEKGGRTLPNLELEGDMLRSLEFKETKAGIEVGIFDSPQTPKAYNHNVGDTLPKRQFVPEPKQRFVGEIEKGIQDLVKQKIIDLAFGEAETRTPPRTTPSDLRTTEEIRASRPSVSTSAPSVFGRAIKDFLGG